LFENLFLLLSKKGKRKWRLMVKQFFCFHQLDSWRTLTPQQTFPHFPTSLNIPGSMFATVSPTNASICIWLNAPWCWMMWLEIGHAPCRPHSPHTTIYRLACLTCIRGRQLVNECQCHVVTPSPFPGSNPLFPYSSLHSELRDVHGR